MGLETATYIGDFVPTDPGSSDLISQGDDHIRLVKTVLQNTFPSVEKAFYFPSASAVNANTTIVAANMNATFRVTTTSGAITMTLPTLLSADAGWECFVMKSTFDVNPVFIAPATGTLTSGAITGLASARRNIPGSKVSCYWTGSSWVIGRSAGVAGPVGSCIEYHGSSLPFGYEWPNGQTLASASTAYPEYSAVIGSGVTLDKRGRIGIALDNLGGSAAGRVGTFITGTAIGNTGGLEGVTLTALQIPSIASSGPSVTVSGSSTVSNVVQGAIGNTNALGGSGLQGATNAGLSSGQISISGGTAGLAVTSNNTGGNIHSNLQPSIMVSQILVVE